MSTGALFKCSKNLIMPVSKKIVLPSMSMSWACKKYFHSTEVKQRARPFQPVSDLYTNPIDRLQPFVQIPLVPEKDYVFQPSRDEIIQATEIFEPLNLPNHRFEFLGSYPNPHIMPQWDLPEIAFIGKSNVGKSSLLAAMFAQIPEITVRCSSKPGHTKLMNVFRVGQYFNLVDMPGYGFNMPDHFETSVEAYIKSRRNKMTFILIDGSVGVTRNDEKYFKRYTALNLPLCIVMTKIDKAHPSKLLRNLMSVMKFMDSSGAISCFPQPFLVSSMNGEGLGCLQAFVAYITGRLKIEELS